MTPPAPGTKAEEAARRRAACLLRWYPRAWRDRYAAEFTELLVSDITERPRSLVRTLDVARGGLLARLASAGLTGFGLPVSADQDQAAIRARHAAASLALLGSTVAAFLVVGAAQWSQLLVGWVQAARLREQDPAIAPPLLAADRNAVLGGSAAILVLIALAVVAALPVIAVVGARLVWPHTAGERRRIAWPAALLTAAVAALVIGGRSVENSWTGTGGLHSPVPGGLAAFTWAVTLFVSAYWAHPGALAAFPAAERDWMALSPLLLIVAVISAAVLVRRVALPSGVTRFAARLGLAGCVVMTVFTALCAAWLAADGPLAGRPTLLHAGWINVAGTAFLVLTLPAAAASARTAARTLARRA